MRKGNNPLQTLPEYPFKLSSNNQRSSTNHRSDSVLIQSCDQVTEIRGKWNCMENKCHINFHELQATFFCLKAFSKNKTRLHVFLKLDNTKAVAQINKKGGTISASSNKLAKDIWNWVKGQDIWITASNVPRGKNTTADFRSRLFYDNKE